MVAAVERWRTTVPEDALRKPATPDPSRWLQTVSLARSDSGTFGFFISFHSGVYKRRGPTLSFSYPAALIKSWKEMMGSV